MTIDALGRLPEEWRAAMQARGEAAFRGGQIFRWIHGRGVTDPASMTDLSKALRASLAADLGERPTVAKLHRAGDDTRKLLVRMGDGLAVETVLLPVSNARVRDEDADAGAADDEEDEPSPGARVTQCISTQVGCAMGCVFCASGVAGLSRHLTAGEIAAQVLLGRSLLADDERLTGIVFMGMGEPLDNYEATARAIRLLCHPEGIGLSPRRITVSTSGLVPAIRRLGEDFGGKVGLAISLHNANDARRSALMPINRKYPLADLVAAMRAYPLPRGRRITIEYTLVAGQNDALTDAEALVRLVGGLRAKVNLIPMNPIEHSRLGPPPEERVAAFQARLTRAGLLCFVRRRRGDDVAAACGQLALLGAKPTKAFERRQPRDGQG
jgi:23S rRNA (adenine2503-C2)-methyltransferase